MNRRSRMLVRLAWTVAFATATIFLATFLQIRQLHRTVAAHSGTVLTTGTTHPVEIIRDKYRVPHIHAQSRPDAYFALGYVHAQDRMWQMEMSRRVVAGRIAEIMGKPGLTVDRFVRTAGLYRMAAASIEYLDPETLTLLEAYAAGVNTAMTQMRGEMSPEFAILGIKPEPWTPTDSLAVFKMLAVGLSGNMFGELQGLKLLSKLTPEQFAEFVPPYPGDDPIVLPSLEDLYEGAVNFEDDFAFTPPLEGPQEASNNWAVDGTKTATGRPLLSNDPHLSFDAPSVWYLAHIALPEGNVIGGTMAGIPAVLVGRTDHIAWGLTTTGADVQDLYLERINPDAPHQYQTPAGWSDFETRQETIKVRFGADDVLEIRKTRHGPILPTNPADGDFPPDGYVLALQWPSLAPDDRSAEALMQVLEVKDWTGFNEAFRDFVGPMQNIVYADVDGNIGFVAPARIPVRGPNHQTKGLLPAPGWRTENDWQGFLAFEDWPRIKNPEEGRVSTANSKITPEGYEHFIAALWPEPHRTWRINNRLDERTDHDLKSFQEMHLDNTSLVALELLPYLLATPAQTNNELRILKVLDKWDGDMRAAGPEGLVYSVWAHQLGKAIYEDELGEELFKSYKRIRPTFLTNVIRRDSTLQHWCDRTNTEPVETCEDIFALTLNRAARDLVANYPDPFENEDWGDHHKAIHRHQPLSVLPVFSDYFNIETRTGGGPFTPNQGAYNFNGKAPFQNRHGAGYRAVYDFEDLDRSRFVLTTGQSGNVFSPHYRDMAPLWEAGELISMSTSKEDIASEENARLTLQPADQSISH